MSGRFGEDKIAEVRDRTSITELISRYTALKRTGRNHSGLCPFHSEKTPSFSVSEERGLFYCFGCHASGDVFKFVMLRDNLTFPEALERLAREAGVELPKRPADERREQHRERFHRVNAFASKYFQRALWETPGGQIARDYLAKRAIDEAAARQFGLGYASADGLARALERAKAPLADAQAVGLIGPSKSGSGWYDRYRNRLMFPIVDLSGNTIGFGGRLLAAGEGQAKYINSSDSPVFHKGRSVYNLGEAREAIRQSDRLLLVEGYVDVIALVQAGIANVVAPLGTALTADQVRLLKRFTDKFTVLFDGDAAGIAAAARSFEVFAEVGLFPEAAFLPSGHDPDTFVREFGREGVERLVAGATPLVDHYLRKLAPVDASLTLRAEAARSVAELCERLEDPVFVGLLRRCAADALDISEDQLRTKRAPLRTVPAAAAAPQPRLVRSQALSAHELALVEILLVHPELRRSLPADLEDLLSSDDARALFVKIRAADESTSPTEFSSVLPPAAADRVARAWIGEDERDERYATPERLLEDGIAKLRALARDAQLRALSREIRDAESRGDGEALQTLLAEKQKLSARGEPEDLQ